MFCIGERTAIWGSLNRFMNDQGANGQMEKWSPVRPAAGDAGTGDRGGVKRRQITERGNP